MAARIHPTAIVDAAAEIGDECEVGPYCIVGPHVQLGAGCWLQAHVTIAGPSRIGTGNRFYHCASIGQQTQDLKYAGEPTLLEIGNDNSFREFVTIHRSTAIGGATRIGNGGNFLAYSHIAHDCVVGDGVIFSNNGTLAGHVQVGNYAVIGGLTAIHQFCRIGQYAITGGCSKIVQDVPPFMIADGNPAEVRGINKVGMERNGIAEETIRALREAYRILYRRELNTQQAITELQASHGSVAEVRQLIEFLRTTERGIVR
jgi:UDP-N-acetylglucosamine acyltransferase